MAAIHEERPDRWGRTRARQRQAPEKSLLLPIHKWQWEFKPGRLIAFGLAFGFFALCVFSVVQMVT